MRVLVFTLLLVLAASANAAASNMKIGNEAYQHGDYAAAVLSYESLVERGIVHEDLYYNLGNAHYRLGHYGQALFNYERALRLAPQQADSLYNVGVAREAALADGRDRLQGAEQHAWWVRLSVFVRASTTTLILLIGNLLFFTCLIVLRFVVPGLLRRTVVVLAAFLGITALCSGLLLAGHVYADENLRNGMVTADFAIMREGPDETLEERGQLHPGLMVSVLAREPEWLLIRLANGVEGWVPRRSIGLFE